MQLELNRAEFSYLAKCLGGFFFGIYSGIFAMHLQCHASKKGGHSNTKQNIALWVLYVLSAAVTAFDIAIFVTSVINHDLSMTYQVDIAQIPIFGCCDYIAQSILIHRCWIVWGRNIRVAIIPSILAFAFLVMWLASTGSLFTAKGSIHQTGWGDAMTLTSLIVSMIVNALVTGLIVFRIFTVFHEVRGATSGENSLGFTGGRKLRSIMFVMIESGMVLFAIQLARFLFSAIDLWMPVIGNVRIDVFNLIVSIHEMLNGITPTIILVRVSMGFSFHDEPSLVEAVGSFQLAFAENPNLISEMESISQDGSLYEEAAIMSLV